MDVVRKFGLYIAAGVLLIVACVFYLLVVSRAAVQRSRELGKIEEHAEMLKQYTRDVPNLTLVQKTREAYEKEKQNLDACEKLFANQPRDCHRRRFFLIEDPTHPDYGKPCVGEVKWLERYEAAIEELHLMLEDARMSDWIVRNNPWGTSVPQQEEIQAAQEAYWFQKDLAEMLTDGTEAEFEKLIKMLKGGAEGFPEGPADLVIDFNATRRGRDVTLLDESLRNLPQEKLLAVLEAIIINRDELDLPSIFDRHLREQNYSWAKVRELTMSREQEEFLRKVRPLNEPDVSYHQRFLDYVNEMRTVRYRSDVVGLLNRRGFREIEKLVSSLGQEERERIRGELRRWSTTKLAQAIAAVVSVRDKADYELIRDNHKLKLAAVESLTFTRPVEYEYEYEAMDEDGRAGPRIRDVRSGGTPPSMRPPRSSDRVARQGGPMDMADRMEGTEPENELAKVWTFDMRVKVEFERIPVFQRRFMSNCWHYGIEISRIAPGGGSSEMMGGPDGMRADPRSRGRMPAMDEPGLTGRRRSPAMERRRSAAMPRPEIEPDMGDETARTEVQSDRYVWLDCSCTAHQYIKEPKETRNRDMRDWDIRGRDIRGRDTDRRVPPRMPPR